MVSNRVVAGYSSPAEYEGASHTDLTKELVIQPQAPYPLNLHISHGGISRKKSDATKVRLTKAEMDIRTLQFANDSDDAMLHTMADIRFAVECVVDSGGIVSV